HVGRALPVERGKSRRVDQLPDEEEEERLHDQGCRVGDECRPVAPRDQEVAPEERRQLPQLEQHDRSALHAPGCRDDAHASPSPPTRLRKARSISERSSRQETTATPIPSSAMIASLSTARSPSRSLTWRASPSSKTSPISPSARVSASRPIAAPTVRGRI